MLRRTRPFRRAAAVAALTLAAALPLGAQPSAVTSAAPLAPGAHEVVVNGVRLWYRVAGTPRAGRPPVVYLHGGPGYNSHSFAVLAGPRLEGEQQVVYLDQRGSGRSERPWTHDYALATLVADLEALRTHLGVEQVALLGHSFGGTLALEYAAAHPTRVSRLVLVDGMSDAAGTFATWRTRLAALHPDALARALADTSQNGGPGDDYDVVMRALGQVDGQAFFNAIQFRDSTLRLRQDSVDAASGLRNTGEMSGALFSTGIRRYRFAGAARLTMPVLVLGGRHDGAVGIDGQRALAASLPRAMFLEYEQSAHFPYLEEPDRFARDVLRFLAGG